MGDMPCVWCLLYISNPDNAAAFEPGRDYVGAASFPVPSWAAAGRLVAEGFVIRDHHGVRCGLMAQTLVSGDAVCLGHALSAMAARPAR